MPLFSIPLSGLSSNSDALSVISNNLANLNTIGYKNQSVAFSDLFYQSLGTTGGGDPVQVGAGSSIESISSNFNDGNLNSTGVSTDVAIQGEGFFIVDNNGTRQYTRAGHFKISDAGFLTTQDGQNVMGYQAVNGTITSTQTLSPIQLNRGQTSPPSATSLVRLNLNLNSGSNVGTTYSTPLTIYDSLGNTHVLQFQFDKASANNWNYSISLPASDFSGMAQWSNSINYGQDDLVQIGSDTYLSKADNNSGVSPTATGQTSWTGPIAAWANAITYASGDVISHNGSYYRASGATTGNAPDSVAGQSVWAEITTNNTKLTTGSLTFDGTGKLTSPVANVSGIRLPAGVSFANGAAPLTFDWNLFEHTGSPLLTQTAAGSSPSQTYQDGYSSGTLKDYSIGADGIVQGSFSNGQSMAVAQIALARFANVQGLNRVGANSFTATIASGDAVVGVPNVGGRGKLAGGNLEMSNVDMSKEFSNLIITQRGFQANARVITTFDQVTQETINLKQG